MSGLLPDPPLLLGPRPLPQRGGTGVPTFRQVPFVRINERIEQGCQVRKQLKKYIESTAQLTKDFSNNFISDVFNDTLKNDNLSLSNTCMNNVYEKLIKYNAVMGTAYTEVSRVLFEYSQKLDNVSKLKKWNKEIYNCIQKTVTDVNSSDKKMEKAILRTSRAEDDFYHWTRVHDANVKTLAVQPNNPDCVKGVTLTLSKLNAAKEEYSSAVPEFEECKVTLHDAIARRDEIVDSATEISQSVEEDHLDATVMIIKCLIEAKKNLLAVERQALEELEQAVADMNVETAIQQFVVVSMQPELTHRQAKALYLLDWHYTWHLEQQAAAEDPLSNGEITENDVEIMKDFVASCFANPDRSDINKNVSTKHRSRFVGPQAIGLYRLEAVRKIILSSLNSQRCHSQELSGKGYEMLGTSVSILLDACVECNDTVTAKNIMNMSQTFYRHTDEYLQRRIRDHQIWRTPQFWGDALLIGIGEEMSRSPQEVRWYHLSAQQRLEAVQRVHNAVFGQLGTFIYNMATFGLSKKQIIQFVQAIAFSFELSEDKKISIITTVDSIESDHSDNDLGVGGDEAAAFAINIFPDEKKEARINPNKKLFDFNALGRFIGFKSSNPSSSAVANIPTGYNSSSKQVLSPPKSIPACSPNHQTSQSNLSMNHSTSQHSISQPSSHPSSNQHSTSQPSSQQHPANPQSWEMLFGQVDTSSNTVKEERKEDPKVSGSNRNAKHSKKKVSLERQRSSGYISPSNASLQASPLRRLHSHESPRANTEVSDEMVATSEQEQSAWKQQSAKAKARLEKRERQRALRECKPMEGEVKVADEKIGSLIAEELSKRQQKERDRGSTSVSTPERKKKIEKNIDKVTEVDESQLSGVAAIRARFEKRQ